jgi:uncharacterized protein YndB with AHSA1/START domain
MALESFRISDLIPATPARVYAAWLDGDEHGRMTGGAATCDAQVGGQFTAWDGYIIGTNLELAPLARIVQSWRSSEFPDDAVESRLEVLLEPEGDSTRVTILHSDIPEGQGSQYEQGWQDHYFNPMKRYFTDTMLDGEEPASVAKIASKPKAKAAAKSTGARKAKKSAAKKPAVARAKKASAKKASAKKPARSKGRSAAKAKKAPAKAARGKKTTRRKSR